MESIVKLENSSRNIIPAHIADSITKIFHEFFGIHFARWQI